MDLSDHVIIDEPEPIALRSSETVCAECWLAYARGLGSCPHCAVNQ